MGTRYSVLQCERVDTKYGASVCLTRREDPEDNVIRVFLQRHYGAAITDEDMAAINARTIQYYLTYKGRVQPPTALCCTWMYSTHHLSISEI